MPASKRLWLMQNFLFLKGAAVALGLFVLLLFGTSRVAPKLVSYSHVLASSDRPTTIDLNSQIAIERLVAINLSSALDSVNSCSLQSDQALLASIRQICQQRRIEIVGYDRVTSGRSNVEHAAASRLSLDGTYYALTMFVADLESFVPRLVVRSLSFESKVFGRDQIRCILVVGAGD